MIHFMIDFENTKSGGLRGAEYLQSDDAVTIFYSQACMKIEQGRFRQLKESGCHFDICKLRKTGKNALDFYIASHIGEIYGQGYNGITAIVSRDTGFHAVKDYWKSCASVSRNIILQSDIEKCILISGENSPRQRQIRGEKQELRLEDEHQKYIEQLRIRRALTDCFADSDYEDMTDRIMGLIVPRKPLKLIYLDSVKQFGKRDGLSIYHTVKNIL